MSSALRQPRPSADASPAARPPRRDGRWQGGAVAFVGFLLSPLSWWNDLFVNVPLALAVAWVVSLLWPAAFTATFVVAYWLTNVLGLVMLHKGAQQAWSGRRHPYSGRALLKDAAVALAYTALLLWLIRWRVFQPLPEYLRTLRAAGG